MCVCVCVCVCACSCVPQVAFSVVRFKTKYGLRKGVATCWLDGLVAPFLQGKTPKPGPCLAVHMKRCVQHT